jgi:hypothetical protein
VVTYLPMLQQALRDVSAWVETGKAPPASTAYQVVECQIVLGKTAKERRGVQPVMTLNANGATRAEVQVGQLVQLSGTITVPPGTGVVVGAEWDFDGSGDYPEKSPITGRRETANVATTHTFTAPGTYFVTLRGFSQRKPDGTPVAKLRNLARARVVVQ